MIAPDPDFARGHAAALLATAGTFDSKLVGPLARYARPALGWAPDSNGLTIEIDLAPLQLPEGPELAHELERTATEQFDETVRARPGLAGDVATTLQGIDWPAVASVARAICDESALADS